MKKRKLVKVEWIDSYGEGGWHENEKPSRRDARCTTVGYVVGESSDFLVVAGTVSRGEVYAALYIPKSSIEKVTKLKGG